jgi:flagellar protein FliS
MYQNPQDQYLENAVLSASPVKLVAMLYDGAIRFCNRAKAAATVGNVAETGRLLSRAHDIISELSAVLDAERGGTVAKDLAKIYDFSLWQLAEARIRRDPKKIDDVIRVLTPLKESWDDIARRSA